MADEEMEAIKLPDCKMCAGKASVRRASNEWWYVGCIDCFNKRMCQREFVVDEAERFNSYARRCGK